MTVVELRGKFCPICQIRNDYAALRCAYCGASFPAETVTSRTTEKIDESLTRSVGETFSVDLDITSIPRKALLVYVMGCDTPFVLKDFERVIFGRRTEGTTTELFDLTPYDAARLGVSRKHASIQYEEDTFTLTDLDSTNGSWLNQQRLAPGVAYPLTGIDIVTLGRLKLLLLFSH